MKSARVALQSRQADIAAAQAAVELAQIDLDNTVIRAPADGRLGQVLDDLDELKGLVNQLQKSVLQLERKQDKDQKDGKAELKDLLERMAERIDKRLQELAD